MDASGRKQATFRSPRIAALLAYGTVCFRRMRKALTFGRAAG
jgi:hypothetical protein